MPHPKRIGKRFKRKLLNKQSISKDIKHGVPTVMRRIQFTQTNNLLLEKLYEDLGASSNTVVNKALDLYKESLNYIEIKEEDFYIWYVNEGIRGISKSIVEFLTSAPLSSEEMEKFLAELIFRKLTSREWGKSAVMRRYHTAKNMLR